MRRAIELMGDSEPRGGRTWRRDDLCRHQCPGLRPRPLRDAQAARRPGTARGAVAQPHRRTQHPGPSGALRRHPQARRADGSGDRQEDRGACAMPMPHTGTTGWSRSPRGRGGVRPGQAVVVPGRTRPGAGLPGPGAWAGPGMLGGLVLPGDHPRPHRTARPRRRVVPAGRDGPAGPHARFHRALVAGRDEPDRPSHPQTEKTLQGTGHYACASQIPSLR